MVQMGFCDLSHTFHKQVTNVSPECFCNPTVGNFDVSPKLYHPEVGPKMFPFSRLEAVAPLLFFNQQICTLVINDPLPPNRHTLDSLPTKSNLVIAEVSRCYSVRNWDFFSLARGTVDLNNLM